jgi:hypothetical protein
MAQGSSKRGFFRSAVDALVSAREKQVQRYVNSALLMLDDETLRANGFSREELKRRGGVHHMF